MKIVSICVNGLYTDDFLYQENLLPLYQFRNGNDVCIIASEYAFGQKGELVKTLNNDYVDNNGIHIIRLPLKGHATIYSKFKRFIGLYSTLEQEKPDIIFCHLFQCLDSNVVAKYVKDHPHVQLYVDSHADSNNSGRNYISRHVLHGIIWRRTAHILLKHANMFYGVTPARVDFLRDVYKIPKEKSCLLPMGVDDDLADEIRLSGIRRRKRTEYGLDDTDVLLLTGGKIDYNKPQVIDIMKSINGFKNDRIKLLVFGSIAEELKKPFEEELSDKVRYIGWKTNREIYEEFVASDLILFPGLHSALWEQAVGMGKPCVFRKISGFMHVDLGGNCMFFDEYSQEHYSKVIGKALTQLNELTRTAQEKGPTVFSYRQIALQSINDSSTRGDQKNE